MQRPATSLPFFLKGRTTTTRTTTVSNAPPYDARQCRVRCSCLRKAPAVARWSHNVNEVPWHFGPLVLGLRPRSAHHSSNRPCTQSQVHEALPGSIAEFIAFYTFLGGIEEAPHFYEREKKVAMSELNCYYNMQSRWILQFRGGFEDTNHISLKIAPISTYFILPVH